MKTKLLTAVLLLVAGMPAFAGSDFQNSCSNIHFAYVNNQATLQAECLRANGTVNSSSLTLQGISNQNGRLVQGSGNSTFQQSCGNIQIVVKDTQNVELAAFCRNSSGGSNNTSLALNGISNNNGNLTQ